MLELEDIKLKDIKETRKPFVVVFFVVIAIFSIFLAWETSQLLQKNAQKFFSEDVEDILAKVEVSVNEYVTVLESGKALFSASDSVERVEWHDFYASQQLLERFEGIQAVSSISIVSDENKVAFEEQVRSDTSLYPNGSPNFSIHPSSNKEQYYVVNYLEPLEGNEEAFGFDLSSNSDRLAALERSRDTNSLSVTAPIRLVQETGEQAGFLMFLPVYNNGADTTTLQQKQRELAGFISGVFRAGDLFKSILGTIVSNEDLDITICDELTDEVLYSTVKDHSHDNLLAGTATVSIGGRNWTLKVHGPKYYKITNLERLFPFMIGLGGILFSFVLSLFFLSIIRTKNNALRIARHLTENLRNYKLALEGTSEHVIITDPRGVIVFANKAVSTITGYEHKEIIGKTPRLWGQQMPPSFYKRFWKTISEKKQTFTGEIKNKRKNGEVYDAQIVVTPILNEQGEVKLFIGLEQDITHKKEIDRAKSEFVSLASHQLKAPLTSFNWNLELLEETRLSKKQQDLVGSLAETSHRMKELVTALLNTSRIDLGVFALEKTPVDFKKVAKTVIKDLESLITTKSLKVKTSFEKGLPKVDADPQVIQMMFQNIISNAVKYTPENGKVSIKLLKHKSQMRIEISDTGYGIPKEEQAKIFTKLYRASNIANTQIEGTGLGLYIVKSAIEAGRGKIWFESEEGLGTTFFVEIPLKGMKARKGTKSLG